SFLMPATDKERLREKKETLAAFLDLVYPPEAVVQAWRKQLWITHRLNRRPSIHHMWTLILCDLVDCLADFCPYAYAIDNPQAPPYDAFVTASSLMHYAQPTLWEDNPERIRSRYQAVQYRKKYPVNHSDGVVR